MSFNKSGYAAALKAADLAAKAETDPANFDAAMTAKSNAYADALATAFSELQMAGATAIATGVTVGAATVPVTSQPGDIS